MANGRQYKTIHSFDINKEVKILLPDSIPETSLMMQFVPRQAESSWKDITGNYNVVKIGNPNLIPSQWGIRCDINNCFEIQGLTEASFTGGNYTLFVMGRHDIDNVYSTAGLFGAIQGTTGSTDPALGYAGISIATQKAGTDVRSFYNIAVRNPEVAGDQYLGRIWYTNTRPEADIVRHNLHVVRMDSVAETLSTFDVAGYSGTGSINKEDYVLASDHRLSDRKIGDINFRIGSFNGNASSDDSEIVLAMVFDGALTDEQVADMVNTIKRYFFRVEQDFDGNNFNTGLSVKAGFPTINVTANKVT
jgi:hypothetical protein